MKPFIRYQKPEMLPMIVRRFRAVSVNPQGYERFSGNETRPKNIPWFVPLYVDGRSMAVYRFELYFADSYRHYATEYVRARDNRQARQKIQRMYPNVVKFQWDSDYA
jgi:hypothetical protein